MIKKWVLGTLLALLASAAAAMDGMKTIPPSARRGFSEGQVIYFMARNDDRALAVSVLQVTPAGLLVNMDNSRSLEELSTLVPSLFSSSLARKDDGSITVLVPQIFILKVPPPGVPIINLAPLKDDLAWQVGYAVRCIAKALAVSPQCRQFRGELVAVDDDTVTIQAFSLYSGLSAACEEGKAVPRATLDQAVASGQCRVVTPH